MGAYIGEVRSVLRDVALEGAVVIGKKKLFWLLGWRQDRAGAWQALLDAWEANDEDRSTLKGSEVGDKIVLMYSPGPTHAKLENVTIWAKDA